MCCKKQQNVIWGNKQLTGICTSFPDNLLCDGKKFCIEQSGIYEGRAYVKVAPANEKIAEILIAQIENNGTICTHDLSKTLEMT